MIIQFIKFGLNLNFYYDKFALPSHDILIITCTLVRKSNYIYYFSIPTRYLTILVKLMKIQSLLEILNIHRF
jgi:hypothetical protein